MFNIELSMQSWDIEQLKASLLLEEHKARLELLAISVLSGIHAFRLLYKASNHPSPLGSEAYSLLSGLNMNLCGLKLSLDLLKPGLTLERQLSLTLAFILSQD